MTGRCFWVDKSKKRVYDYMRNAPFLTILTPTYNRAHLLGICYESLLKQTNTDFEWIIVDDGSTDSSAQIAEDFIKGDHKFRLIKKANGGTATARNMGLRAATGEYVQFLDADDELDSRKLELQAAMMDRDGLDMSYTDYRHFHMDASGTRILRSHPAYTMRPTGSLHLSLLTRWGIDFSIPIHCILYRRSFIVEHHLSFSETLRYREDWDFHLQASAIPGFRYGRMPQYVAAYYRENPNSKTSSAQKLSSGNLIYLSHAIRHAPLADMIPLAFHLACELILVTGRACKHRQLAELRPLSILVQHANLRHVIAYMLSIVLLPLSILYIIVRSIIVYL